jgi:glucose/arabinose dehydrogenase
MHKLLHAVLATAILAPATALAQRNIPMGAAGFPDAPTGLEGAKLGAGPFSYSTGEGQDIRVTVLARMPWPFGLAFLPNGDLLVAQRTGEMKRIAKGSAEAVPVPGGPQALFQGANGPAILHGYMHIALHPRFASNGLLYLSYSKAPQGTTSLVSAVAQARYVDGRLADVKDVWVGDNFYGPVAVAMTPDAKLFVAVSGLAGELAQDPAQIAGKVLRLNEDGSVPKDNPFVGKAGYRPEIFTLGHRSTSALAVHPTTGEVYLSEMGPNGGDEINHLKAGRNYGWPLVSFGRTYPGPWQKSSNVPDHSGFEPPILYWTPSISVSGLTSTPATRCRNGKVTCLRAGCAMARYRAQAVSTAC